MMWHSSNLVSVYTGSVEKINPLRIINDHFLASIFASVGNAMNLQLSIDAAQDKLAVKDEDISPPLGMHGNLS